MNIKTIDRDFYVLHIMEKSDDYEYMLCIDNLEEKNNKYDILKVKNYSLICKVMPLLNEQLKNRKFTDFKECFSQDNVFYAVFKHNDNIKLAEKLENTSLSIIERNEIMKNLAEKIVMTNIPYPVQTDILLSDGITISESLSVGFKYNLKNISDYQKMDFKSFQKALSKITEKLFEKEIKNNVSDKLNEYLNNLKNGNYNERIEIYSEYVEIYEELKNNANNENPKKKSRLQKFIERIKAILRLIKPFAVALLIISALLYLLYTLFGYEEDTGKYNTYKSIGTLPVKEYISDETEQKGE